MNMNNLMKQAQQMQAKLAMLQNELNDREVEAAAGGRSGGIPLLVPAAVGRFCCRAQPALAPLVPGIQRGTGTGLAGSDPAGADRGGAVHLRIYETYGRRKVICARRYLIRSSNMSF